MVLNTDEKALGSDAKGFFDGSGVFSAWPVAGVHVSNIAPSGEQDNRPYGR
jgi:hypothetical protein